MVFVLETYIQFSKTCKQNIKIQYDNLLDKVFLKFTGRIGKGGKKSYFHSFPKRCDEIIIQGEKSRLPKVKFFDNCFSKANIVSDGPYSLSVIHMNCTYTGN